MEPQLLTLRGPVTPCTLPALEDWGGGGRLKPAPGASPAPLPIRDFLKRTLQQVAPICNERRPWGTRQTSVEQD